MPLPFIAIRGTPRRHDIVVVRTSDAESWSVSMRPVLELVSDLSDIRLGFRPILPDCLGGPRFALQ